MLCYLCFHMLVWCTFVLLLNNAITCINYVTSHGTIYDHLRECIASFHMMILKRPMWWLVTLQMEEYTPMHELISYRPTGSFITLNGMIHKHYMHRLRNIPWDDWQSCWRMNLYHFMWRIWNISNNGYYHYMRRLMNIPWNDAQT